jgi:hypothetical protein
MPLPTREELEAQKIINQLKINSGPPPGQAIQTTFGACPQCGIMHPPLRQGERCPLATVKTKEGKVIDFEKFLADLKIMLISQFEIRKVTNHEDVFKKIKMEVMKILEGYKP